MDIFKSSRHSKIAGDFGESLVLYWLSKFGFECARVDHTGIDLIARNPHTVEVMGISVKSRTRTRVKEEDSITIPSGNFEKATAACRAFGCIPYFAVVVDAAEVIRVFLLQMDHFLRICPVKERGAYWQVSNKYLDQYMSDPEIKIFELRTSTKSWWRNLAT